MIKKIKKAKKFKKITQPLLALMLGLAPCTSQAFHFLAPYPYLSNNAHAFMTSTDVLQNSTSGLQLQITTGAEQMTGIFIQQVYGGYTTTSGTQCEGELFEDNGGGNGMLWTNVSFAAAPGIDALSIAPVGQNFLYNMLSQFMTQIAYEGIGEHDTPGKGNGEVDGTVWCIKVGLTDITGIVMGPGSNFLPQIPGTLGNYNAIQIPPLLPQPETPNDVTIQNIPLKCFDSTETCIVTTDPDAISTTTPTTVTQDFTPAV